MSIFSSKLSELMDQQKINDAQLAEKLNISRTTVLRWRSGERSPKLGKMNEIAAFFGVSPKVFVEQNLLSQTKNNESKSAIPKYGYVTAGPDGTAFQEFLGYEIFDDVTNPEDYFALDVSGDSMTGDGILDGDTVLIQVQPTIDYNGQIAVVIINGEEELNQAVIEEVKKLTLADLEIEVDAAAQNNNDAVQSKIDDLEKQINRLLDLYQVSQIPIDVLNARIEKINNDKRKLAAMLQEEKEVIPIAERKEHLKQLKRIDWENESMEIKRKVLKAAISRIDVENEKIRIDWKI